jgi:hypothetical protein
MTNHPERHAISPTQLSFSFCIFISVLTTISAFIPKDSPQLLRMSLPPRLNTPTALHQSSKQQQQRFISDSSPLTPTISPAKTTTSTLFPPTSKYHPDRDGLSRRRRWLVVDFDGTCTEHDTTPLLPRLAAFATRQRSSFISADGENYGDISDNLLHKQDLERRLVQFQCLEDEFVKRYEEAKSSLLSNNIETPSQGEGKDLKSMHDILDGLDEPSTIVTGMVSDSRVLAGLGDLTASELEGALQLYGISTATDDELSETADLGGIGDVQLLGDDARDDSNGEFRKVIVRLRHGCEGTLARILSENNEDELGHEEDSSLCLGWGLAVLSINWCPALIDASLIQPVLKRRRSALGVNSCTTEIPIWSNQVDGNGVVSLHVPGASAKRDRIIELRRHIQARRDGPSVIVYVGDSPTDLSALLEADIGVIMGNSSSTNMLAARFFIQIKPLQHRNQHGFGSILDGNHDNWRKQKLLWRAESWKEIDDMLIQLEEHWS